MNQAELLQVQRRPGAARRREQAAKPFTLRGIPPAWRPASSTSRLPGAAIDHWSPGRCRAVTSPSWWGYRHLSWRARRRHRDRRWPYQLSIVTFVLLYFSGRTPQRLHAGWPGVGVRPRRRLLDRGAGEHHRRLEMGGDEESAVLAAAQEVAMPSSSPRHHRRGLLPGGLPRRSRTCSSHLALRGCRAHDELPPHGDHPLPEVPGPASPGWARRGSPAASPGSSSNDGLRAVATRWVLRNPEGPRRDPGLLLASR